MTITTTDAAQEFTVHGVTFRSYSRTDTGAAELAAWEATVPPRTPGVAHEVSREEVLRVLAGRVEVQIDGVTAAAGPGDAVVVPPGAVFRMSNLADEAARLWVVTSLGLTASVDGQVMRPPWAA